MAVSSPLRRADVDSPHASQSLQERPDGAPATGVCANGELLGGDSCASADLPEDVRRGCRGRVPPVGILLKEEERGRLGAKTGSRGVPIPG